MAKKALTRSRLNRLAKSNRATTSAWKEGVSLESDTGATIQNILMRLAAARWRLAYSFKNEANRLMQLSPPMYRSAISRYYYSMYHATRACVFIDNEGDDHEAHSQLPTHIPATLDPAGNWQNKLKDARLLRNRADYDAYPRKESAWKTEANDLRIDSLQLMVVTKNFLITKGCRP